MFTAPRAKLPRALCRAAISWLAPAAPWLALSAPWLALCSPANAAPLQLRVSPGATLELLPAVQPERAEILVYDNRVDLRPQIQGRYDGVRGIRVVDMGDLWVVNVQLRPEAPALALRAGEDGWSLVPALSGAVTAPPALAPCASTPLPISPLQRGDMSYGLDPLHYHIASPRWTDAEPAGPGEHLSGQAMQAMIDDLRGALFVRHEQIDRVSALYRLGALHRDTGRTREAAYYFHQAAAEASAAGGAPHPHLSTISLQLASALVPTARWEDARAAAQAAAAAGAPEDTVLEMLSAIALAEGGAQAADTAIRLARASARPMARALSGALLMQQGCAAQVVPILQEVLPWLRRLDPERAAESRAMLADAMILTGRFDEADDLLAAIGEREVSPQLAGILRARTRLLALLRLSPDQWGSMAPGLDKLRNNTDPDLEAEEAESLFLLGQIQEWLGDDQAAIQTWQRLLDRNRRLESGQPAKRLAAAWARRDAHLHAEGRIEEAMALHLAVWRPGLSERLDDPEPLRRIAEDYRRLGVYHRAVSLLGTVAEMEGRLGRDDQRTVFGIADIYLQMGLPELAEDALRVLRARALQPGIAARVAVLEGQIAEQAGDRARARARYAAATAAPEIAPEARARIAALDMAAGDCAAALPHLDAALDDAGARAAIGEGVLRLWRAACLSDRNPEGAAVEGFRAAQALQDSKIQRFAGHISTESARTAAIPTPGNPAPPDPPDIWRLLEQEEEAAVTFAADLRERQR